MISLLATVMTVAALLFAGLWLHDRRRAARSEVEIESSHRRARRAEAAQETFFDLVTHELRSPLSAILGYHELLQDGAYGTLPEEAAEPVGRIGRSARHLLHLIDGVVELSRIRAGGVRPVSETVNLGAVFPPVAEAFSAAARDRGIEPHVHITDRLPTIRSDQDRLVRALDLLVTSAVKHPAGSGITLHMTADDAGATVRVTDTEIAITQDVDDLALRLGIRLAVVDAIARVLGGALDLDADDQGTIRGLTFRIRDRSSPAGPAL